MIYLHYINFFDMKLLFRKSVTKLCGFGDSEHYPIQAHTLAFTSTSTLFDI